ncbi:MAG: hypothetical protein AAB674_00945 [Patescibacteria group bacterium]
MKKRVRRRLDIAGKVRELRNWLGGRRSVVRMMDAASPSSLKRWERRKCKPLRAHVRSVNEAYAIAKRMSRKSSKKLH